MHPNIESLRQLGHRVRQCSPYHYQVYFDDTLLNIWISSRGKKWMPETSCPAKEWNEIKEIVSIIESRTRSKEEHATALAGILDRLRRK